MITRIKVPLMSANMEEGMVGCWLKQEGDSVDAEEPLLELITDKADFEVPAPATGTLLRIVASPKSVVPVGYILGVMGDPDDEIPDVSEENRVILAEVREAAGQAAAPLPEARREPARAAEPRPGPKRRRVVRATPAARRVAREHGVDLAAVQDAGGEDVVTEQSVRDFMDPAAS